MNIKIAICEDTNSEADMLQKYLLDIQKDIHCDRFSTADLLLESYSNGIRYELIFMDIEMPGTSGIEAAKYLHDNYHDEFPLIVFLTVSEAYLYVGYHIGWNYVKKPIERKTLLNILNTAITELSQKKITIETTEGIRYLNTEDVLYFESYYGKVRIVLEDETFLSKTPLSEVQKMLTNRSFSFSHRCYLVNLQHVVKQYQDKIFLPQGLTVPLSRNRKAQFSESMTKFLRGVSI